MADPISQIYQQRGILNSNGEFCDPQIGCSDRLTAMDLSTAKSRQFSQELRLASDFDGPFNFSLGANFLRYDTEDKYYVFINSISMLSAYLINGFSAPPNVPYVPNVTDNRDCLPNGLVEPNYYEVQPIGNCVYIDPNPVSNLNDLGHNYFLSRNPYKLISYAVFGEAYYNIADNLKVTAGLRWTVDKKEAPEIPSWIFAGGTAGYPVIDVVDQQWREPTGRLAIDWKPDLSVTDETMIYASYSHGYKAGGMNPPPYGKTMYLGSSNGDLNDALSRQSVLHPKTFGPEFVDAFEIGAKNTLVDGRLTVNLASFYYDYTGYQLSQIVDRSAVTHNYDAKVWGLELESDWRPLENLRLGLKLGYERTKVADGMQAIDVMDRTAGNKGWLVTRPFPSLPTNCVLPTWLFLGNDERYPGNPDPVDVGGKGGGNPGGCELAYLLGDDPATGEQFVFNPYSSDPFAPGGYFRTGVDYASWSTDREDYPCLPAGADPATMTTYPGVDPACLVAASNNGEGFFKQLGGKELPNAPHMTATITADYTLPLPSSWLMTLHTDLYYQSESWTRIFNTEGYDKLKAYSNINLAAIFTNENAGWKVMAYVKNVLDRDSITGAFLNSDDSGLTTNVFLTEPRLYGLRITKDFAGSPWWTGANPNHTGPYPLTVEIGGQVQRFDAPFEPLSSDWADALPPSTALENIQDRDLDWGDGRSLKLTYRPVGSPWTVFASGRRSETNNSITRTISSSPDIIAACRYPTTSFLFQLACNPASPNFNPSLKPFRFVQATSWSDAEARSHEKNETWDAGVSYDALSAAGLNSSVSVSLRHAHLESASSWNANAQGAWSIPDGWQRFPASYRRQHATLMSEREFTGAGPVLAWDGAVKVWGDDNLGRVDIEWSAGGGVLFGERQTEVTGRIWEDVHSGILQLGGFGPDYLIVGATLPVVGAPIETALPSPRSEDATVPLVDLSLGLSYDVGRVKIGAGYRWERYFNVLDVGFDEAKDGDRTIDGPYFKIAVGFGG